MAISLPQNTALAVFHKFYSNIFPLVFHYKHLLSFFFKWHLSYLEECGTVIIGYQRS